MTTYTEQTTYAERFTAVLPLVEAAARRAAGRLRPQAREDAVAEAVADAFVSLRRCGEITPYVAEAAAVFGVRHHLAGRSVGSRQRRGDLLAGRAATRRSPAWLETLADDRRVSPAELAASRIDFPAWLASLPGRHREIAEALAAGLTTGEAAERFGVTAGRISQIRRELMKDWEAFHGGLLD